MKHRFELILALVFAALFAGFCLAEARQRPDAIRGGSVYRRV